MSLPSASLAALVAECAREPIHAPGAVQSFGVLFVLDSDFSVVQCGGDTAAAFGRAAEQLIGVPVADLLPPAVAGAIRTPSADTVRGAGSFERIGVEWRVQTHDSGGYTLVELCPVPEHVRPSADISAVAAHLSEELPVEVFAKVICDRFRAATGYDRVMVYRFDSDWNGQVIAEARADGTEPFLGLHYPASDIPPQARELYSRSRVRTLADADADPSPLFPRRAPGTAGDTDLSLAVLRSLSPVHREYLRNMGVRASHVTSVLHRGRLWGLLACHHRTPRVPHPDWAVQSDGLSRLLDASIMLADSRERNRGVAFAQTLLRALPGFLAGSSRLGEGLIDPRAGLQELLDADGMAVIHRGRHFVRGAVPPEEGLASLVAWLSARDDRLFHTRRLGEEAAGAGPLGELAGLLALHIPNTIEGWVLWFRREEAEAVNWAGDPRKAVVEVGPGSGRTRLSPRSSFTAWTDLVRGRSRAWTSVQLATAEEVIRPNLLEVVAASYQKQAEKLRQYQSILFEQVHDAVIVTDLDGVVTFWNDGATRTLGWASAEVVGRHILDRIPVADRPAAARIFSDVLSGHDFAGVYPDTHKDGRRVWLDIRLRRITDETGQYIGIMGASRDVTSQKATEDALRLKQAIVRQARDSILVTEAEPVGVPGPRIVYANPALLEQTGYTLDELVGNTPRILQGPNTDRAALARIRKALQEWRPIREEVLNYRKDGTEFWIELDITPLADESGWYTHWIGVQRDITGRKRAAAEIEEQQRAFRSLAENGPDPVFVLDPDDPEVPLKILFANEAVRRTHGYEPAELIGRSMIRDLDAGVTADEAPARAARILAGEAITFEATHRHRDGRLIPVEVRAGLITWKGKRALLGINRDITERKKAEEAVRREREFLRRVIDVVPGFVSVKDSTGRFQLANHGIAEAYGTTPEELLGRTDADFCPSPQEAAKFRSDEEELLRTERQSLVTEESITVIDGTTRWLSTVKLPLPDPDGGPPQILIVATDITERRRAEEAVRASEERLQLALAAGRMGTFDWDIPTGRITWSASHYTLFGFPADDPFEVRPEHFKERVHPEDSAGVADCLRAAMAGGTDFQHEFRIRVPGGTVRWILSVGKFSRDTAGAPVRLIGVDQDVTERKTAELQLAEAYANYRLLADHIADVVTLKAADGRFLYVSPSSLRVSGYRPEEMAGRRDEDFVHPDDRAVLQAASDAVSTGERTTFEWRQLRRDGNYHWVETVSKPVMNPDGSLHSIIGSTRDISSRKSLEDQVRQSQKLEAIGQLAGGVAHDFNNLLTVVNGSAEFLLDTLPEGHEARPLAADILRAGGRGAGLTRQLLAFSRQQLLRVEVFEPAAVVADMLRMVGRLLGEHIDVATELDADAGAVLGDAGQFEQVVMNLAVNARDAMPDGGRLTVTLDAVTLSDTDTPPVPDARPGEYVRLTVADTGHGMPPEVSARLFEPFFTTKPAGKGTGLGLATVYGIVRQSRGFITVDTGPGRGAIFRAHFPRHRDDAGRESESSGPLPQSVARESILLVEDDAGVRELTAEILRRAGYRVVAAESGAEALRVCDGLPCPPDALLTDVVMSGMGGRELSDRLTERFPGIKTVFLSGYTADRFLRRGIEDRSVALLQKPYTPEGLTRFLREVLDA